MKFIIKLMLVALYLDLVILRVVMLVREWLSDWLSLSYDRFERGIIGLYIVCEAAVIASPPRSAFTWILFIIIGLVVKLLWEMHRRPDEARTRALFIEFTAYARLAVLAFTLMSVLGRLHYDFTWWGVAASLGQISYLLMMYATAIPKDGGNLGKKRKAALSKVKEMFGTSWMPIPVPRPQ